MKKLLLQAAALFISVSSFGQIGATAPDFDVTDINGNQIKLYQDILDQGLIAIVDVSATWCGPCWGLHESLVLKQLHETYGPNGSNQLRVVFYEGDPATGLDALQGTGGSTQGDWVTGTPFPIVNESPLSLNLSIWAPQGFPTVNVIRPSDKQIVADPWNIFTLQGQVNAIETATGIDLWDGAIGVEEISSEASFTAFPNPANQELNFKTEAFKGDFNVEIYNLQGQLVKSELVSVASPKIATIELSSGKYMVRAFNNEHSFTKMVSVSH
jgi:hypothetical protein